MDEIQVNATTPAETVLPQSDRSARGGPRHRAITIGRGRVAVRWAAGLARPAGRSSRWGAATLLIVLVIGAVARYASPAPIEAPWDVFTLLGGAYRIHEGQSAGVDFANPVGPMVYALVALGMALQSVPSLLAVTYGELAFLALASTLAWIGARARLPLPWAAGFTTFVAVLSVAVRPLGYSPWTTTYAMLYDRYGWLLYATLLLLVLTPRRARTDRRAPSPGTPAVEGGRGEAASGSGTVTRASGDAADGLLLGVLLGLLFTCKITYFLAGLAATGLGLVLGTLARRPRLIVTAVAGFVAVCLVMVLAFHVSLPGYLADVVRAAQVQVGGQRLHELIRAAVLTAPVVILAAVALIVLWRSEGSGVPRRELRVLTLGCAFVVLSSLLLTSGNADERGQLPALVVVPLLIVAYLALPGRPGEGWRQDGRLPRKASSALPSRLSRLVSRLVPRLVPRLAPLAIPLLVIAAAGPTCGEDALGLAKSIAFRGQLSSPPSTQVMDSPHLRDFVIPATAHWQTAYRTASAVPGMLNDGLAMLRSHLHRGDTELTLAYTDPFAFALGLRPPTGNLLWWDLGYDFDEGVHPAAAQVFGHVTWVMVPQLIPGQGCCQQTVATMLKLYSPYLSQNFTQVTSSSDWTLFERKVPGS